MAYQRAKTAERGYGTAHQRLRREWAPRVASGTVRCARCGELIATGDEWDLGHDDFDRSRYSGPEHAGRCNRRAGAKARAAKYRKRPRRAPVAGRRGFQSQDW